ncbi:MAG: hypothetical protein RDV48_01340 [Candidatus Eremiobacteraeota bacterium]|nr:hypothetical protein [Candidatus Eremiobacteraeota bacterium]
MEKQPDYIIYKPVMQDIAQPEKTKEAPGEKVLPMTAGVWQKETLDVLSLYDKDEGSFSPVTTAGSAAGEGLSVAPLSLRLTPEETIPHWKNFKFLADDTLRTFRRHVRSEPAEVAAAPAPAVEAPEVPRAGSLMELAGAGSLDELIQRGLFDPQKAALKADDFEGRATYAEGGLYEKISKKEVERLLALKRAGKLTDPKDIEKFRKYEEHGNAPNYRKMDGKPVHGVGQPTEKGFEDVLSHVAGADKKKPIVWMNMRAEPVIYINGKPLNMRQIAHSKVNMDLGKNATAADIEKYEEALKEKLQKEGKMDVVGEDGVVRTIAFTPDQVKTTQDVVAQMRGKGYTVEYKRIPVTDESSPDEKDLDTIRNYVNEMKKKHPGGEVQFVCNCHQGKGRTTTAMVAAGITLDGKGKVELFGFDLFKTDDPKNRAERTINQNAHVQNLRECINEYKKRSEGERKEAEELKKKAASEESETARLSLEKKAKELENKAAEDEKKTREFTRRYAMMVKYSEYICEFGSEKQSPTFEQWIGGTQQQKDLAMKWASLNDYFGIRQGPGTGPAAMPETALA